MESHINLAEVGAFPFMDAAGEFHIRFGLYLPGIRAADGFEVEKEVLSPLASRLVRLDRQLNRE